MKVRIEIDTQTFIRFWLVLLGFVVAAVALYSARTALILIGTALFLALALNGPVSRLAKHLPGNSRAVSTAISYVVVVAFLGAFIFLAVPPIVQQTAKFVQGLPVVVDTAQTQWNGLNRLITEYNLQPQVDKALAGMSDNASKLASSAGTNVIAGVGSLISVVAGTLIVLFLTFFMLIEGPTWMKKIWALYTNKERMEHHRTIARRMNAVVAGYVTGQLTVSAIGAAFAGITVFVLSWLFPAVPSNLAVPAAAMTFIFSLIPMFGSTIGAAIISLLLVVNSAAAVFVYLIYFVIYQQIENNYISPTIQSKRNNLTPLAILASVTIGIYLFGLAGGIVSIPVAGCVQILFEAYVERRQKKNASEETEKPHKKVMKKLIAGE